jgi:opacity protein-like surface antigen
MFGPKVAWRQGVFTPFAHVLFGGVHGAASVPGSGSTSGNNFASAIGGGLDVNVAPHLSIRVIQAEYMYIRDSGGNVSMPRISAGIVFRSGS